MLAIPVLEIYCYIVASNQIRIHTSESEFCSRTWCRSELISNPCGYANGMTMSFSDNAADGDRVVEADFA